MGEVFRFGTAMSNSGRENRKGCAGLYSARTPDASPGAGAKSTSQTGSAGPRRSPHRNDAPAALSSLMTEPDISAPNIAEAAIREHFVDQAAACETLGSPFTTDLCRALAKV